MPCYGPLNRGVPIDVASRWLGALMGVRVPDETDKVVVLQLARRTGDRYRDLDVHLRREVLDWLDGHHAPTHFAELVATLDRQDQGRVFGKSLPKLADREIESKAHPGRESGGDAGAVSRASFD